MQLQSFITKQKLKFKRKRSQKLKGKNGWIKKLYVHCRDTDMKKPAWQPFCWSQVLSFNNQQNLLYKSYSIPSCPSLESWCYERNWLKCLNWSGTFWPISVFFCIWTVYWQWSYLITTFDQFSKKCLVNCQNKGQWFAIDRFKSTKTYFKEWILGNFYSFPYRYHDHDRLLYLATQFYI